MKKATGWNCLLLALLAFAGIGLEAVLAFAIEPMLYGAPLGQWNTLQNVLHWTMTCILWGAVMFALTGFAKKRYSIDLLDKGEKVRDWQWVLVGILVAFSLVVSYIDWNGFKVLKEFQYNGLVKFIFQYIYYLFEAGLMMLILVFAQLAFEKWFGNRNIPYGGIILALTWGLGHILTKNFANGILSAVSGLAFGSIYLLVNRDIRKCYPIMFAMFVL